MKKQKYDLESLIETFEEHAKRAAELAQEGNEYSKGKPLEFNIATALHRICLEIQEIKTLMYE
jgi:hypothetical protein